MQAGIGLVLISFSWMKDGSMHPNSKSNADSIHWLIGWFISIILFTSRQEAEKVSLQMALQSVNRPLQLFFVSMNFNHNICMLYYRVVSYWWYRIDGFVFDLVLHFITNKWKRFMWVWLCFGKNINLPFEIAGLLPA